MAGMATQACARLEASGELPALAVRRMLRQHDCADSVASDEGGGGAGEAAQDEQAGMARAVAAARCARASAKFAEGRARGQGALVVACR